MAEFLVKATAEEAEKAGQEQGEFEVPKPGFYHVKLIEANAGFSKGSDGEPDPDKPRIECIYEIVGEGMEAAPVTANYGRLWDYITFGDGYAATRRTEFTLAFHPEYTKADVVKGVKLDTDDLVERVVVARIKHEVDKQKTEEAKAADRKAARVMRARIQSLISLDKIDAYSTAEQSGNAYESADQGDPFAEEAQVPGDTDAGDSELLTREELEAMEMKELGSIAKEFDLDPNDSVVKARGGKVDMDKSKAKIIEAILTAQDGTDEGDGDTDNPF